MNQTYYIAPEYLKLVGKRSDPVVSKIYENIHSYEKNLNTKRKSFLQCSKENISLVAKGFDLGIKDVKSIMESLQL
jgi:hypothetical protein